MHIIFTPALGQLLDVSIPVLHPNPVHLSFTAILTARDSQQLDQDGAQLQIWSDIPAAGREPGQWGELPFQHCEIASKNTTISLLSSDTDRSHDSQRYTLRLELSVPLSGQSRFSFTYRLVYPSGEIKWLGGFGDNGTLLLQRADPLLVLGEGWSVQDNVGTYTTNGREAREIARLDNVSDYAIWAIVDDSLVNNPVNASLILLIPRIRPNSVLLPKTFVLSASPRCSITLDASGAITAAGDGSFLFQTWGSRSGLQEFLDSVMSHSSTVNHQFVSCDANQGHAILFSPKDSHPVTALVIPLSPSTNSQVRTSLKNLAALLPGASQLALYSHASSDIRFLTVPPVETMDDSITFIIESTGSQFTLASVYNLTSGAGEYQVSIVSPHVPTSPNTDSLPTPPPSPHLRPITSTPTLNGSLDRPAPTPAKVTTDSGSPRRPVSSKGSTLTSRFHSQGVVRKYMSFIFVMAAVFLRSFLGRAFAVFRGRGSTIRQEKSTAESTPLLKEAQDAPEVSEPETITPPTSTVAHPTRDTNTTLPSYLFVEIPGGQVWIALRSANAKAAGQLMVALNGQAVEYTTRKIDENNSVLGFSVAKAGRMRISLES